MKMKNNENNFMNKDIMPLDTRIESEYDIERALKHEYDNLESFSCHSGLRAGIQKDDNLMPKAFRFAQSGRSMVEMLGVVAVVGVLSIGGIMGYSYAVDKYHANQVMNDVNLRGIDLIAQASRGGDLSLAEWPTKTSGDLDIGLEVDEATNTTEGGIYVNKVPQRVCEIIAESISDNVELTVNGVDYTDSCAEENKMVFYYTGISEILDNTPSCIGLVIREECIECPTDTTWDSSKKACICNTSNHYINGTTCTACPENATLREDGKGCICAKGIWTPSWNVCAHPDTYTCSSPDCSCPTGDFSSISFGAFQCIPCPSDTTFNAYNQCICPSGKYPVSDREGTPICHN